MAHSVPAPQQCGRTRPTNPSLQCPYRSITPSLKVQSIRAQASRSWSTCALWGSGCWRIRSIERAIYLGAHKDISWRNRRLQAHHHPINHHAHPKPHRHPSPHRHPHRPPARIHTVLPHSHPHPTMHVCMHTVRIHTVMLRFTRPHTRRTCPGVRTRTATRTCLPTDPKPSQNGALASLGKKCTLSRAQTGKKVWTFQGKKEESVRTPNPSSTISCIVSMIPCAPRQPA